MLSRRVVRLAVLLDAVGEGLEAPILVLGDLAAALGQDFGQGIGHFFDLLGRNVLAGQIDMLVKGHECAFLRGLNTAILGAEPLEAGKATKQSCKEREHGRPGIEPYCQFENADPPFSPRPNECEAAYRGKAGQRQGGTRPGIALTPPTLRQTPRQLDIRPPAVP